MSKPATGELRKLANGYEARIRVDDEGTRKGVALTTVAGKTAAGSLGRAGMRVPSVHDAKVGSQS